MFDKKFSIIKNTIILLAAICLVFILFSENKKETIKETKEERVVTEELVLKVAKDYVNDNKDYFNDVIRDDVEFRIDTRVLVDKKYMEYDRDFVGYIKINKDKYEFVKGDNLLIDRVLENQDIVKNEYNENMPYDISYNFRGEPNNYIEYDGKLYRIIGVTNSNNLKVISKDQDDSKYWVNNNINVFSDENKFEGNNKGIFYVGFVRSETTDIDQIFKNERRNNNYTSVVPKYYSYYLYANISDIVMSSDNCKFSSITSINSENCDSYLLDLLKNSYLITTGENNKVYVVNENKEVKLEEIKENIKINKVLYINGLTKYISGNGELDNPYRFE